MRGNNKVKELFLTTYANAIKHNLLPNPLFLNRKGKKGSGIVAVAVALCFWPPMAAYSSSSSASSEASTSSSTSASSAYAALFASSPELAAGLSASMYMGLGLGLSVFLLSRIPPLKPLSSAVKLAESAIKVPKAIKTLNPASPMSLYSASRALFKSCKATTEILPPSVRKLQPKVSFGPLSKKQVKALFSTANLLRYALSPSSSEGALLLNLLKCGYKVSKNFTKVLEGFVGLRIDSTIRTGVDALGIMVKTAGVVKEVTFWLAISWWGHGSSSNYHLSNPIRRRSGLCLCYKGNRFAVDTFTVNQGLARGWFVESKESDFLDKDEFDLGSGFSISELLSLSVPVHEIIPVSSV